MNKIAIQGHVTRGKDIIKILENLGGKNMFNCEGYNVALFYYINSSGFITCNFSKGMPEGYEYYTLEDYEQQLLNTMETKRNIQIDLTTAKEWYKQGGDLRKIALQAFSQEELQSLPKSWEEYCKINHYLDADKAVFLLADGNINPISSAFYARRDFSGAVPSKERAEQFLTLNKLLQIRDYYNQGWKSNWDDGTKKYVIWCTKNELYMDVSTRTNALFAFRSKEARDEFVQNFEEDLKTIKEFL
jgi:hypothetical protein